MPALCAQRMPEAPALFGRGQRPGGSGGAFGRLPLGQTWGEGTRRRVVWEGEGTLRFGSFEEDGRGRARVKALEETGDGGEGCQDKSLQKDLLGPTRGEARMGRSSQQRAAVLRLTHVISNHFALVVRSSHMPNLVRSQNIGITRLPSRRHQAGLGQQLCWILKASKGRCPKLLTISAFSTTYRISQSLSLSLSRSLSLSLLIRTYFC